MNIKCVPGPLEHNLSSSIHSKIPKGTTGLFIPSNAYSIPVSMVQGHNRHIIAIPDQDMEGTWNSALFPNNIQRHVFTIRSSVVGLLREMSNTQEKWARSDYWVIHLISTICAPSITVQVYLEQYQPIIIKICTLNQNNRSLFFQPCY